MMRSWIIFRLLPGPYASSCPLTHVLAPPCACPIAASKHVAPAPSGRWHPGRPTFFFFSSFSPPRRSACVLYTTEEHPTEIAAHGGGCGQAGPDRETCWRVSWPGPGCKREFAVCAGHAARTKGTDQEHGQARTKGPRTTGQEQGPEDKDPTRAQAAAPHTCTTTTRTRPFTRSSRSGPPVAVRRRVRHRRCFGRAPSTASRANTATRAPCPPPFYASFFPLLFFFSRLPFFWDGAATHGR